MNASARVLKGDHRFAASRIRLTDLSESADSRCDSAAFEPLTLPINRSSRPEPHEDSRLPSALAALQSAADQLNAQRDQWLEQSQREAVQLGIAIAERLLRRTLNVQPDAVFDLIRSALDWSSSPDHLRVRLHPEDAELVGVATEKRSFEANRDVEFFSDDSLARGDCIVESPNGQTDARLDVILQRIADELLAE